MLKFLEREIGEENYRWDCIAGGKDA